MSDPAMIKGKFLTALERKTPEGKARYVESLSLADRKLLQEEMVNKAVVMYFGACSISEFLRIVTAMNAANGKPQPTVKPPSWLSLLWKKVRS